MGEFQDMPHGNSEVWITWTKSHFVHKARITPRPSAGLRAGLDLDNWTKRRRSKIDASSSIREILSPDYQSFFVVPKSSRIARDRPKPGSEDAIESFMWRYVNLGSLGVQKFPFRGQAPDLAIVVQLSYNISST